MRSLPQDDSLLIYAPVPVFRRDGQLYIERQALNGVRLWAANFAFVTIMMPLDPGPPPVGWVPLPTGDKTLERIAIEPLPMAYRPDQFLRHLTATRARICTLMASAQYLSFAIGGLFGDWGAVSCLEAHRLGRPFAVWTDRVESEVMRSAIGHGSWRHRLRARLYHRPMARLERRVIGKSTLGLFHGHETFESYAPFASNPHLVHDIHISVKDHISGEELSQKQAEANDGPHGDPLRICYVGRMDDMKGPLDWVDALGKLAAQNVAFEATWLGDGDLRSKMAARIDALGLTDRIHTPGFADNREAVLEVLRQSQVFMFCHKTPESPRCLIEALISGAVLVGYDGAFARDLTAGQDSGVFVPIGDVDGLAQQVAALAANRRRLADLIGKAVQDGAPFDDVSVFRHRSTLIKKYLC
ncbi:MAG: colanic acid/amylovoran biosynthesis glycosyltransferase [Paracoccaceae bacterium]|jgi:colanic acid/amylovoran biosynthesis glycosyltransferase